MKRASIVGAALVGLLVVGGLTAAFGWCSWSGGHGWASHAGYVRPATNQAGSYWCCPMTGHAAGHHAAYNAAPRARYGTYDTGRHSRHDPASANRKVRNATMTGHHAESQTPRTFAGCCCR